jgi:hypothetical protein
MWITVSLEECFKEEDSVNFSSIITEEFKQAYHRWKSGEMTAVKAMQAAGFRKTTFYKLVKEYERALK